MTYYGPDWLRPYSMAIWYPEEWLNGSWSKNDQDAFDFLYDFNILGYRPFGSNFDVILNRKNWEFYSDRAQMDYSDIYDPRKFKGSFGMSSNKTALVNFISSNAKRLYD